MCHRVIADFLSLRAQRSLRREPVPVMPARFPYDVFLSHDHSDKPQAALASGSVGPERSTAVHRAPANVGLWFIPLPMGQRCANSRASACRGPI